MTSKETISIFEASKMLNVSTASIRNWIKAGYLTPHNSTSILRASLEHFKHNIIGKEKLNQRANKQYVDAHNHFDLTAKFFNEIEHAKDANALSKQYESELSNSHKNKEGLYYTPSHICKVMFSDIPKPKAHDTFLDPCCGTGNFLIAALEHGFKPENIYGFDTDLIALKIAQKRIYEKTGVLTQNIAQQDYLEYSMKAGKEREFFNVIATNPPWGKKISKKEKDFYSKALTAGKSLDSCALFMFAAFHNLKENGALAFLMPDAFFNIAVFKDAREKLLSYKLISLRNFDRPFKGLFTGAQSFCALKAKAESPYLTCRTPHQEFKREQRSFFKNPFHIINVTTPHYEQRVIEKIYSHPHITLKNKAQWGLGIVTGNNKKFCKENAREGYMAVYKGRDIKKGYAHKPQTFIPQDLSLYQQVARQSLYEADEKILYRFISSHLMFYRDTQRSYFLNSVNMVLPDKEIFDYKKLVALFNSDLYDWLFSKIFSTHKILRADLEHLPIPIDFLSSQNQFSYLELLRYYNIERNEDGAFREK